MFFADQTAPLWLIRALLVLPGPVARRIAFLVGVAEYISEQNEEETPDAA